MSAVMLCHDDEISSTPIATILFIEFLLLSLSIFKQQLFSLSFFQALFPLLF